MRDGVLILIALASLRLTPDEHREANGFTWEPIREVAILFAGIFVAIVPVMAMLGAGSEGTFAFLLQTVTTRDGLRTRPPISGLRAYCPRFSTTPRPISYFSSWLAATPRN